MNAEVAMKSSSIRAERGAAPIRRTLLGLVAALAVLLIAGAQAQEPLPTVQIVDHPELGPLLVGPEGFTLYTFGNDRIDELACTGGCAVNFPPLLLDAALVANGPIAPEGLTGELGTITRGPDEEAGLETQVVQVTYNGQPLYYWSRDKEPGDATGHGIGERWYVARP